MSSDTLLFLVCSNNGVVRFYHVALYCDQNCRFYMIYTGMHDLSLLADLYMLGVFPYSKRVVQNRFIGFNRFVAFYKIPYSSRFLQNLQSVVCHFSQLHCASHDENLSQLRQNALAARFAHIFSEFARTISKDAVRRRFSCFGGDDVVLVLYQNPWICDGRQ